MSNLTFELPLTRIIALVEQWLAHANLMSSSDYAAKFAKSAEQYVADFHKLLKEAKNAEIQ